ncbi:Transcriptional activator spt7 [Tulasnella sp. JGI-2019a]|nr:Transcriptional activator spt7 [Tulasnella sp. JGI-2019a]
MKHLLEALDGRLNVSATDVDINHLLNDIRATKGPKSTDHFYDTLDRVLNELKSTQEAGAFLRAVKKAEAPDYDQYVKHPMDLGTVQKKVKAHTYQNKQQFASDLNLIWDNCLLYNSDPNHHLRRHANFMREKADYMLERITDVNERFQPANLRFKPPPAQHYSKSRTIESSDEDDDFPLKASRKHPNGAHVNGVLKANGHVSSSKPAMNGVKGHTSKDDKKGSVLGKRKVDETPFLDRPAIVRTSAGMASFRDIDIELQRYLESEGTGPSRQPDNSIVRHELGSRVSKKLRSVVGGYVGDGKDPSTSSQHNTAMSRVNSSRGEKARDLGAGGSEPQTDSHILHGWWQAMSADSLQASGLPALAQAFEPPAPTTRPAKKQRLQTTHPPIKKGTKQALTSRGLPDLMRDNIATLRNMRKLNSKITSMQIGGNDLMRPPSPLPDQRRLRASIRPVRRGHIPLEGGTDVAKRRMGTIATTVLEHAGFEGASKNAMDVLTDVAADFIMNLGRTLSFYTEKHGQSMTPEEIILHTLFENGTMETQELERYIKEDVERYGSKIHDIEKKFAQTYQELTETTTIDDEELFGEGDGLMAGGWTEELGEDFFGFRALGLDKELGLTSMSIPSKLWNGRAKQRGPTAAQGALSTEPPPPYPPPPPFLPIGHDEADAPPGLLQPFYRERFEKLAALNAIPSAPPPLPAPNLLHPASVSVDVPPPVVPLVLPSTVPDDLPDPLKMKSGPLGQITVLAAGAKPPKPPKEKGTTRTTGKKKKAGDEPTENGGSVGVLGPSPSHGLIPSEPLQVPPGAIQGQQTIVSPQQFSLPPAPAAPGNPTTVQPLRNATPATHATTPSPAKKKNKTPKKKPANNGGSGNGNTGGGGNGAPQAGPIVMATA